VQNSGHNRLLSRNEREDKMRKRFMILGFILYTIVFSAIIAGDNHLFAQYPPTPTGCCMQRDWLAGEWYKTELSFTACEELNRNRDSLDDVLSERGYVWWDVNCTL
jgi:hypothetical protein